MPFRILQDYLLHDRNQYYEIKMIGESIQIKFTHHQNR